MFDSIIGNEKVKENLINLIKNGQVLHSYLFVGIEGIGKKLFAKELAKAELCTNDEKLCNNCKSCLEFDSSNHPDFMIIEPENNSIKIEQIRKMQKAILEKPIVSDKKVYIIDDADCMTQEAQNCLLKTLEEPPEFVIIILIGSNESAFLNTIKSRCMIIKFSPIENDKLEEFLKRNYGINSIEKNMLEAFQGSISKAISIKDKKEDYENVYNLINNLENSNLLDTISNADLIYKSKDNIIDLLEYMNLLLLTKAKTDFKYANCIEIIENTKKRLKQNSNYDMTIDNMLFHIWEEVN